MWTSFRSEDMSYIQMLLPSVVSEEFADNIGRNECIEFTDLNADFQPFQRPYTKDIIRIQEIERRIKEIEGQLRGYRVVYDSDILPIDIQERQRTTTIDAISRDVNKTYEELKNQVNAETDLCKQLGQRKDSVQVLRQIDDFLAWRNEARAVLEQRQQSVANRRNNKQNADSANLLEAAERKVDDVTFKYIAGVVTVAQRAAFERQVFLTSRGNSLVHFEESHDRMVFAVFFLGNQLQRSLKRLCQFMNIYIYYESDSEKSREALLQQAERERTELIQAHHATKNLLMRLMNDTASQVKGWKIALLQEKGIRVTLNKFKFKVRNNLVVAEGWCATNRRDYIQEIMEKIVRDKGVTNAVLTDIVPRGSPPTYFEPNEFIAAFQAIVDTYGVPRYKEFNPAIPTIITFPFLFGVMYGDIFHGSCLLLASLSLLFIGRWIDIKKTKSSLTSLYFARYVLVLMGFFAVYCGLIYNDCMSIMINGWNQTQWKQGYTEDGATVLIQHNVYAVGMDPAWSGVDNQLTFANSLKMKLSVIIGVTQMTFGLFLKLSNHIQEGDYLSVFFEFIPQLIFMVCFFGYMVFLIFYKWCIDWSTSKLPNTPSLITVLINMFLSPGTIGDDVNVFGDKNLQALIQVVFLLSLVGSIPVMLIVKPLVLRGRLAKKKEEDRSVVQLSAPEGDGVGDSLVGDMEGYREQSEQKHSEDIEMKHPGHKDSKPVEEHHEPGGHSETFGDIMIHQLIHTIEYVLGTISNTASYLRLWALSLAHAELSDVFYSKTLESTLAGTGVQAVIMNVVSTGAFLMFTCGVLLVMDVLECFLHALRLHWVEFQNKFFYADGRAFRPFSFAKLLESDH